MNDLNDVFIHPAGNNREKMQKIFSDAVLLLIDFLSNANSKPSLPVGIPGNQDDLHLPANGFSQPEMLEALKAVLTKSMNPANTSYIGHMDSLPTAYSIIGSLYSAAVNNNMFSLEMSPYFTRLEYGITEQFARLFGLPPGSGGIVLSGGTLSNIQAIITARNYFLKTNDGCITKPGIKLALFASEHAHISLKKAMMIAGIGTDGLIKVKTGTDGKMIIDDLKRKIATARDRGMFPFAIVATAGTTVTGNIDPLRQIARIAKEESCWFHADAIYGGAIIFSANEKHRLQGIELADSIAFNPQKWMHVAKTCSLLLFRNMEILKEFFSMKATYVKDQNEFINLSELSLQGTKHAEILKLWLSILSIGLSGYGKMVDKAYAITKKFVDAVGKIPEINFASPYEMNIPTFRLTGRTDEQSDEYNRLFNEYALKEHNIFFSLPTHNGKLWQRTILLNPFIDDLVIEKVVIAIKNFKTEYMNN